MTLLPFSTALLAHYPTLKGLEAFSAALSIFFPTWVSIALIVLVQLNYVIAPRIPVLHRF